MSVRKDKTTKHFRTFAHRDEATGSDITADRFDGVIRVRASRGFWGFSQDIPVSVAQKLHDWLGEVLEVTK